MEPEDRKNRMLPLSKRKHAMSAGRGPLREPVYPGRSNNSHQQHGHHPTIHTRVDIDQEPEIPFRQRCCTFIYNSQDGTFCGRTCMSWFYIIVYSTVYVCFLATYTMIILFGALLIIKSTKDFNERDPKIESLTYSEHGVGLSLTPLTETYQPLLWYRQNHSQDYEKYVNALDELLIKKRRERPVNLGPCGVTPYGYDAGAPCVIVRINKQFHWAGKPLLLNSSQARMAPVEVQNWMKKDKKLWLNCEGVLPFDKEHIGKIRYFPDPPGFEPTAFPLGVESDSPLVAMQILDFTLGLSLSVECKLWYANGPASVEFMLYVASDDKAVSNRTKV